MDKIQILLSTYNGGEYLSEQLNSYLSAEGVDFKLLVRDDGSSDNTREILEEFKRSHPDDVELIFGENIGLNKSMHELIKRRDRGCKLFAFSDQDDVWVPEKLSTAEAALEGREGVPALFTSPSFITNRELDIIGTSPVTKRPPSFYNAMVENIAMGHTQVFNRELALLLEKYFSSDMHIIDYWAYMLAVSYGEVVVSERPLTLYRQHGSNTIGIEAGRVKKLLSRVKRALTSRRAELHSRQLKAFLETCPDIPEEYRLEGERFLLRQKNFFTRLGYIFVTRAYRQSHFEDFVFRMMYLFGKYKIKEKKTRKGETK